MAGPTLPDCRLPKLRRHHRATAGQAQTPTYPRQRSSTGSRFPYRFRPDTGPCVGTGEGWPGGAEEVAVSGNGIVKTGRHAQSHHPKRRGINAHAATVRRQVCHHWPTLLPDGTDPNVWQQANADLHRSLLDLRGACSRAERVPLALGEVR